MLKNYILHIVIKVEGDKCSHKIVKNATLYVIQRSKKQNLLDMVINTKNQYNTVLKEIDVLLELSCLNNLQTIKLKVLIDALDEYQSKIFDNKIDVTSELAKDFSKTGLYKFN